MELFKLLKNEFSELNINDTKIHLAVWNGEQNPLDVYFSGKFEEWQREQSKRNFERKYIVSLIQMQGENRWLFAGCYKSMGCVYQEEKYYLYDTEEVSLLNPLSGRLVVSFKRSGRQSYLVAENWHEQCYVSELFAKKLEIEAFRGYNHSLISKQKLDIIVKHSIESWRAALENVSGVYLITDTKNGKKYVGSATGEGGIWQRWCQYSYSEHGNNVDLRNVLKEHEVGYSQNFQFCVLEIADTHASKDYILKRESYWKNVLCSRTHGYNSN